MDFFRSCPGCKRRFHVKLESKKLIHLERHEVERARTSRRGGTAHLGGGGPIILEVEEFQYNYKCKHCGHEWSDKHIEEPKEG